ncbi:MAG: SUMF1/EgtB/PvdO family nonheme iron enzyme [Phycisphaeraceae bacterium]|nr:SUMF1/EgtB/PvdO family nonheme iron enzyme [Phycisphaerae bacterium]MBX3392398.1 SUMF1/EgtB/PvdO family nonheme iron enzyme [Phycisphaeraceae bacterium]
MSIPCRWQVVVIACLSGWVAPAGRDQPAGGPRPADPDPALNARAAVDGPFSEEIPGAAFSIRMTPIPGDPSRGIEPFWMSVTEVTWDAFDVYVYRLDEEGGGEAVARGTHGATRPTKPYLPPDRGLGHSGFATISVSYHNAATFCEWLSEKTGRHYRLPTEQEWEYAALAGASGEYGFGSEDDADAHAWFADNSDLRPRPVGRKTPNAWGLHDMHGNIAEWARGRDGKGCLKGGSYLDPVEDLKVSARRTYDPAWNAGDPNMPKSRWWLTDGPFIGFRIVRDSSPRPASEPPSSPPAPR